MFSRDIKTVEDIEIFFSYLVHVLDLNFHPDTDFSDYVSSEDGSTTFSEAETSNLNTIMQACFEICERHKVDIHEIGLEILKESING